MVDEEMDLDTRNYDDAVHAHDDPIDYDLDIDITNDGEPTWDVEDVEIQEASEELPDVNVQMEEHVDVDHDIPSDAMDTLEAGLTAAIAKSDADMLSDVDPNEIITIDHAIDQDQEGVDGADVAIVETTAARPQVHEEAPKDAKDTEYLELSDVRGEEPEEITYEEAETAPAESAKADANTEDAAPVVTEASDDPGKPAEAQGNGAINDELTWEEDDIGVDANQQEVFGKLAQGEEAIKFDSEIPSPVGNEQEGAVEPSQGDENDRSEQFDTQERSHAGDSHEALDADHEAPQHEEAVLAANEKFEDEVGEADDVEALPVTQTLVEAVASAETTSHGGAVDDDQGQTADKHDEGDEALTKDGYWPAITVQYKGEEFPCFAAADGFFTQASVVEESMEKVLVGLRQELSAELAEDEELVFHVDELGLEFAESTQRELLSATTLRSILDLYEMLVQNQDQDAQAKPLYTYLFTRSSPSKRLEYLMESAANGRGLDEVIHLFEPAILHSHETSHDDSDLMADELGEHLSPGDELQPISREVSATHDIDDLPESRVAGAETLDNTDYSTGDYHGSVSGVQAYDGAGDKINDDPEEIVGEANVEETSVVLDHQDGEGEVLQHDTEQPEVTDALEIVDKQYQEEHEQPEADDLYHEHANGENKATTRDAVVESSATSTTLDGTEPAAHDVTYDEQPNDEIHATHDGEEDFAEIDWKDDEDEHTAPVTEQSPSAKRTRTEEEIDGTEGNYTKRQRSS